MLITILHKIIFFFKEKLNLLYILIMQWNNHLLKLNDMVQSINILVENIEKLNLIVYCTAIMRHGECDMGFYTFLWPAIFVIYSWEILYSLRRYPERISRYGEAVISNTCRNFLVFIFCSISREQLHRNCCGNCLRHRVLFPTDSSLKLQRMVS